jgi:hypothetical protein
MHDIDDARHPDPPPWSRPHARKRTPAIRRGNRYATAPYERCANASFMAAWSSAGVRSLRCVANDQWWPKGSVTTP